MRRLLVDGMNVIGSRPDGWWRDRTAAMRRLVAALEPLAAREEVTVVFDGEPREVPADRVRVRFAGPGRDAADAVIADLAARDADPASLEVVTSDAALAARVRAAGVAVVGARGFRARIGDAPGGG